MSSFECFSTGVKSSILKEEIGIIFFVHSLTWSFSGYILNHDREKFVDMLKDEVNLFYETSCDGFQVELSGYFSAEITWDFLKGRLDGEKRYKVSFGLFWYFFL